MSSTYHLIPSGMPSSWIRCGPDLLAVHEVPPNFWVQVTKPGAGERLLHMAVIPTFL
ncbi:hypothetical protein BGX38DRAFT_849160 [Terfezia claveryi]|nr:hypothetical protein BGX38DRAFT_849160 [Terfezia claveryi]